MTACGYCDEKFSSKKARLEHELKEHEDEMSSHEEGDKKSELNRLKQKASTKEHNRKQKLKYGSIAAIIGALVIGGGAIAVQNIDMSQSRPATNSSIGIGEAVHWHASYRITVCGENRVPQGGPMLAHTHGETRFHLEGIRKDREQATLGWVMNRLGTQFTDNSIYGKSRCDGEPANLTVKANGNELEDPGDYVIRDGDFIRIKLA